MKVIVPGKSEEYVSEAVAALKAAKKTIALTGAGISVESGIDDFRSPGGIWSQFPVEEYGTIEVFRRNPEKSWVLFRVLGKCLIGKKPNPAHYSLAELEKSKKLHGIVTQNIDGLHQSAESERVFEIHGDHSQLQCIQCSTFLPINSQHLSETVVPKCEKCGYPLNPNVFLFRENVRDLETIYSLINGCDLLLVIGTSAQVYPAAGFPQMVKQNGGLILEFNKEMTTLSRGTTMGGMRSDFFFEGNAGTTVPFFINKMRGN